MSTRFRSVSHFADFRFAQLNTASLLNSNLEDGKYVISYSHHLYESSTDLTVF